jgi:N,N'-diacetyllegionaminate synthase
MNEIKIGNKVIGEGHSAFIVAEMAWSHDGSVDKAKKIVKAAADAGADAINFHITSLADYMIPMYGAGRGRVSAGKDVSHIYDYLNSINIRPKDWREIFQYARDLNLLISTLCNDAPSVDLASTLGQDIYVIPSACLCEDVFLAKVAREKKPIFIRVGGSYLGEMEKAIFLIMENGNDQIALVHGFQNYPTKLEDANLKFLSSLKQIFGMPVGFADHTDGGTEIALMVPLLALAFGANILEKHITYDRSAKGEDFESALDPAIFKKFVSNVREIEKTFGSAAVQIFSEDALNYRQVVKKRTVARKDIKAGERITEEMITFKRADEGMSPEESRYVLGRLAKSNIRMNDPLSWDMVI